MAAALSDRAPGAPRASRSGEREEGGSSNSRSRVKNDPPGFLVMPAPEDREGVLQALNRAVDEGSCSLEMAHALAFACGVLASERRG